MSPTFLSEKSSVLKGTRILSLALNLPGPAALMRCRQMGARCVKIEPPAHPSAPAGTPGDAMGVYNRPAYDQLHHGIEIITANLKSPEGQNTLHRLLKKTDILLTSFRPSALKKLGLNWKKLHQEYPQLCLVSIVGSPGKRAEEPGHDLTYQAENDLINGLNLPRTLAADMAGALIASEAILQARLNQLQQKNGRRIEVALSQAAHFLAMPHWWGLTQPGTALGGGHAGYKIYPCKDGRVAVAALEAHFAADLARLIPLPQSHILTMFAPDTHVKMQNFFANKTRMELEHIAQQHDIPLCTLPAQA